MIIVQPFKFYCSLLVIYFKKIIDYTGDAGRAYLEGQLIADDFYYGRSWEIGLMRFAPQILEKGLVLKFLPLRKDSPIYMAPEYRPEFSESSEVLQLRSILAVVEYEGIISNLSTIIHSNAP